ncbi:MAG: hypothetical protein WEB03_03145 [Nitriliruptor sp.]|uniref:hypothetical protein n=1 Tax=Nitriliruptor sp. TaxID=2448056 RepID=UPI0034A0811F
MLRPVLQRVIAIGGPVLAKWLLTNGLPSLKHYNAAATQARAVGGYVGAWVDDDGKHWVVLNASRTDIVGTFPPMSSGATERALQHLDEDQLVHHEDVLLRRISTRARAARDTVRGVLPGTRKDP